MPGFDPFAFVGDVAKGVGDVAKGVGDIANNAAKIAAGAVDGAIKAMAPEGNGGEQKPSKITMKSLAPFPSRSTEIAKSTHSMLKSATSL